MVELSQKDSFGISLYLKLKQRAMMLSIQCFFHFLRTKFAEDSRIFLQFFDRNYFRIPVGKADAIYLVFFHFLRSELCRRQNSNYARIMSGIPVGKAEVFNELIYQFLTSPTDVASRLTIFSWGTATTLCPLISIIRWPTRTPPRSAMPPRNRLHICKKIK